MDKSAVQPLTSYRQAWAVDWADGPASRWPILVPRKDIAQYCLDRKGFGVPEESLPLALAAFSVCGWRLVERQGSLDIEPASADAVNEWGCRQRLAMQRESVARAFLAWTELQATLAKMEASARNCRNASQNVASSCDTFSWPEAGPGRWSPKLAKRPVAKPKG